MTPLNYLGVDVNEALEASAGAPVLATPELGGIPQSGVKKRGGEVAMSVMSDVVRVAKQSSSDSVIGAAGAVHERRDRLEDHSPRADHVVAVPGLSEETHDEPPQRTGSSGTLTHGSSSNWGVSRREEQGDGSGDGIDASVPVLGRREEGCGRCVAWLPPLKFVDAAHESSFRGQSFKDMTYWLRLWCVLGVALHLALVAMNDVWAESSANRLWLVLLVRVPGMTVCVVFLAATMSPAWKTQRRVNETWTIAAFVLLHALLFTFHALLRRTVYEDKDGPDELAVPLELFMWMSIVYTSLGVRVQLAARCGGVVFAGVNAIYLFWYALQDPDAETPMHALSLVTLNIGLLLTNTLGFLTAYRIEATERHVFAEHARRQAERHTTSKTVAIIKAWSHHVTARHDRVLPEDADADTPVTLVAVTVPGVWHGVDTSQKNKAASRLVSNNLHRVMTLWEYLGSHFEVKTLAVQGSTVYGVVNSATPYSRALDSVDFCNRMLKQLGEWNLSGSVAVAVSGSCVEQAAETVMQGFDTFHLTGPVVDRLLFLERAATHQSLRLAGSGSLLLVDSGTREFVQDPEAYPNEYDAYVKANGDVPHMVVQPMHLTDPDQWPCEVFRLRPRPKRVATSSALLRRPQSWEDFTAPGSLWSYLTLPPRLDSEAEEDEEKPPAHQDPPVGFSTSGRETVHEVEPQGWLSLMVFGRYRPAFYEYRRTLLAACPGLNEVGVVLVVAVLFVVTGVLEMLVCKELEYLGWRVVVVLLCMLATAGITHSMRQRVKASHRRLRKQRRRYRRNQVHTDPDYTNTLDELRWIRRAEVAFVVVVVLLLTGDHVVLQHKRDSWVPGYDQLTPLSLVVPMLVSSGIALVPISVLPLLQAGVVAVIVVAHDTGAELDFSVRTVGWLIAQGIVLLVMAVRAEHTVVDSFRKLLGEQHANRRLERGLAQVVDRLQDFLPHGALVPLMPGGPGDGKKAQRTTQQAQRRPNDFEVFVGDLRNVAQRRMVCVVVVRCLGNVQLNEVFPKLAEAASKFELYLQQVVGPAFTFCSTLNGEWMKGESYKARAKYAAWQTHGFVSALAEQGVRFECGADFGPIDATVVVGRRQCHFVLVGKACQAARSMSVGTRGVVKVSQVWFEHGWRGSEVESGFERGLADELPGVRIEAYRRVLGE